MDNIGARRLHTIMERILEDISFEAPDRVSQSSLFSCLHPGHSAALVQWCSASYLSASVWLCGRG